MTAYRSDLMMVVNRTTGHCTYYIHKCNAYARVSEADYNERRDMAERLESLHNTSDSKYTRMFTTIVWQE